MVEFCVEEDSSNSVSEDGRKLVQCRKVSDDAKDEETMEHRHQQELERLKEELRRQYEAKLQQEMERLKIEARKQVIQDMKSVIEKVSHDAAEIIAETQSKALQNFERQEAILRESQRKNNEIQQKNDGLCEKLDRCKKAYQYEAAQLLFIRFVPVLKFVKSSVMFIIIETLIMFGLVVGFIKVSHFWPFLRFHLTRKE